MYTTLEKLFVKLLKNTADPDWTLILGSLLKNKHEDGDGFCEWFSFICSLYLAWKKWKASAKLQHQENITLWICKKYHLKLKKHDARWSTADEHESNDMS